MSQAHADTAAVVLLRRLARYMRPYLGWLALVLFLTVGMSLVHYGRAYLAKPIFDEIVVPNAQAIDVVDAGRFSGWIPGQMASEEPPTAPASDRERAAEEDAARERLRASVDEAFVDIVMLAGLIVILNPVFLFARQYTVEYMLGRVDIDMKVEVCSKILHLPMRFHQERQRGDTLQRITGDTAQAKRAIDLVFNNFLESVVLIIVGVAGLLFINWRLALVMLAVGPLIGWVISSFQTRIRRSARKRQEQLADVTQRLVEILDGIKIIKAFRAEEFEDRGFRAASRKLFRRAMKVVQNRVLARSLIDTLNNAAMVGVLVLGIWLVMNQRWGLTPGDLAAFTALTGTLYRPIRTIGRGLARIADTLPSAERYFEILDADHEISDAPDAIAIGPIRQGITVRDLSFSYGREPVLESVSFDVPAGQVVAIVGRTGSGKSTLTDLLLRFYDPNAGRIEIDGQDLRDIKLASLLDQVAVVTQEPFLFDGTILENIRYGRPDASMEDVIQAARAAHVDEFVDELPEGYDTEVGGDGTKLSGGQRQRVTIARAILRDPALLILDEATSSLDSQAERIVQDALEKLLPGRTVVVIAHRLATVRRADQIVVLEDGRISQRGTHDELMETGGLYGELVKLQHSDGAEASEPG